MAKEFNLNEFYNILKNFLSNSNEIRIQAEVQLKEYLAAPQKTLLFLINLMQTSTESYIRKLCSVLFRRFASEDNFNKLWATFQPVEQLAIKNELIVVVKKEADPKVAKQVCQAIARFAGELFVMQQEWPELEALIMEYVKGSDFMAENAFRILGDLFIVDTDRFMKNKASLQGLFDLGFQRTSGNCLVAVASALCMLIAEIDSSDIKHFQKYSAYLINLIEILYNGNDEDNLHEFLELVSEVAEVEPKFFRQNYLPLSTILVKVSAKKDYENEKLRQMPLEVLVSILERSPWLVKKHKTQILELSSALFDIAVSIEDEVDEEWLRPKEGYSMDEDLRAEDNVNFAVASFDRLLSSLNDEYIFPIIERVIEHSMSNPDWRYHNAGLMIAGQIGEYCEKTSKVNNLIPILVSHIAHEHPKVRAAALYAIGLLADYMGPEFQEDFGKKLLPPMVLAVEDAVPHVQSNACASLTNFLEKVTKSVASEVAPVLLPKLIQAIQTGISIVKENAVTCISSIAESAEEEFVKYYKELVPFLMLCYKQFQTREYRVLKGEILESLTIMSSAVGLESFKEFAVPIIELLITAQESATSKDDPQRYYLLGSWQRICILLQKDFAPYLSKMIPGVFKIAEAMPVMGIEGLTTGSLDSVLKEVSNAPEDETDLLTSEIEEKSMALQMLQVFATYLEELYAPYVEGTTKIAEPMLTFHPNQGLRKEAAGLLPVLLQCLKKAAISKEMLTNAGSKYITLLLATHDKEPITEVKSSQVLALKDLYETMDHFMSAEDVKTMTEKIVNYFKESNDRKAEINKEAKDSIEEDAEDEETVEELKEKIAEENTYQRDLTYFLGAIENSHKDEFKPLIEFIINLIVQPYLLGDAEAQRTALFILDDFVEYLGVEKLGEDLWKQFAVRIINYATYPDHGVRQAACYGIGALAQKGGSSFAGVCVQCLTTLASAIEIPKDKNDEREDDWEAARDNAIASIGKILKYQGNTVSFGEIWARWLHYLPIKMDKDEAKPIHEFVIDTLLVNPEMAIGTNGDLLADILRISVSIYSKKLIKKAVYPKLAQALKKLNEFQAIAALLDELYKTKLEPEKQATLKEILTHAK